MKNKKKLFFTTTTFHQQQQHEYTEYEKKNVYGNLSFLIWLSFWTPSVHGVYFTSSYYYFSFHFH